MAVTKEILNSHPVDTLKKEIAKTNIRGYSKMKKAELVELMMKHKEKFNHIQKKGGKKVVLKPPKELKESTKPDKPKEDKPKMTKEQRDKRIAEIAKKQAERKAKKEEPKKISAPKWTDKIPSHVFVIKDTKKNAIKGGYAVPHDESGEAIDYDKLYEGMYDPKKTNIWGDLTMGTISTLRKVINKNNSDVKRNKNYTQEDRDSINEKSKAMEKMIKEIQGGRFKFEKKKVEKTKTGVKIDGRNITKDRWIDQVYSQKEMEDDPNYLHLGDETMARYFTKPIDLRR
tara:strand:- start:322 stop:1179 length:858 start_codon:yes stop_codon:yes gene_type:complete